MNPSYVVDMHCDPYLFVPRPDLALDLLFLLTRCIVEVFLLFSFALIRSTFASPLLNEVFLYPPSL